jgi:PAS domain S-box-containing protein
VKSSERLDLERAVAEAEASVELRALVGEQREALELLDTFSRALFPDGADLQSLTWSERAQANSAGAVDPRRLAEERLRAAELRFRALVEQIPAVTFMAALGEGENEVYVSPHIETLLGFSQEEWLENPFLWYRQLHPDDRGLWNDEFALGCQRGGPFRAECRFIARDGSIVWVHGEARVIRDELARPLYLQGIAFDITEAKRAQAIVMERAIVDAKHQEELSIARRVQTSIVPRAFDVAGLEIAAVMVPAEEVGGDYYEVLPVADGAWFGIGDVSGHGLDAGVVMLMLQSLVSGYTVARPDAGPAEVLTGVNRALYDNVRSRLRQNDHVTLTLLRYASGGKIRFAGAHEYLLVWRLATEAVEVVRTPGTWAGVLREISRFTVESEIVLAPGDVMLLYTDGVTEAMNAGGEQFGLERLTKALSETAGAPIEQVVDRVLESVNRFSPQQYDDITIVALRQTELG